jgi:hypothetical protein
MAFPAAFLGLSRPWSPARPATNNDRGQWQVPRRFRDPRILVLAMPPSCAVASTDVAVSIRELIAIAKLAIKPKEPKHRSGIVQAIAMDSRVAMRSVGPLLVLSIVPIILGPLMMSPSGGQTRARPIVSHPAAITEASANQFEGNEYAAFEFEYPRLESLLGREVQTSVEEDGGRIIDLLADHSGHVAAAVIEFGGFLGIGTRKIAVEWSALRFKNKGNAVTVDVTRDQLRAAPEFKPSEPIVVRRTSE